MGLGRGVHVQPQINNQEIGNSRSGKPVKNKNNYKWS
jgi:hypothetical protein